MKPWDYLEEYHNHRPEILRIIDEVFKSGHLILGESVKEFEKNFAQYLNVKYAIGVNSGTDALLIALKALGIGYGDEVITVANTAVPTVSAIVTDYFQFPVFNAEILLDKGGFDPCILNPLRNSFKLGAFEEAQRLVSNEIVDSLYLVGSMSYCREKIEEYVEAGVDQPLLLPYLEDFSLVAKLINRY